MFAQRAPMKRASDFTFLFAIANADGHVAEVEVQKILQIANALRLRSMDFESIKAMFVKSADNA